MVKKIENTLFNTDRNQELELKPLSRGETRKSIIQFAW